MAKKDISLIEKGAGFFSGLITDMMSIVRERQVPFEAIYRLVQPGGRKTLVAMVMLAQVEWAAAQPSEGMIAADLGDRYVAYADYAPLPPVGDLEREFSGEGSVSAIFDGRPWEEHRSRADVVEIVGVRDFFVKQFTPEEIREMGGLESEHVIAWGLKHGLVPANHKEARAFAKANPSVQQEGWIVALGSFAMDGSDRFVAVLYADDELRVLGDGWFGCGWDAGLRFLFVRK